MKIIATDMDGTLVNQIREITYENAQAIKAAQQKGILVVVATGRDYTEAIKPLKEVEIRCPIICVNGAEIRSEDGEKLESVVLSRQQFETIEAVLRMHDIYYEIYSSKGAFTNNRQSALEVVIDVVRSTGLVENESKQLELAEQRFQNGEVTFIEDYNKLLSDPDVEIHKILAFTKNEKARQLAREKLSAIEFELAVSASANDNLEITHIQAQKGVAIEKFAKSHGISLEDVMAIGDNFNDASMLKVAGISVAMGNAEPEIKELASFITKTNEENGVAYAIKRYMD